MEIDPPLNLPPPKRPNATPAGKSSQRGDSSARGIRILLIVVAIRQRPLTSHILEF